VEGCGGAFTYFVLKIASRIANRFAEEDGTSQWAPSGVSEREGSCGLSDSFGPAALSTVFAPAPNAAGARFERSFQIDPPTAHHAHHVWPLFPFSLFSQGGQRPLANTSEPVFA
jgi:hypothetical protein